MNTASAYPFFRWPSVKKMFGHRELYQAVVFFLSPQLFPIAVTLGMLYPVYTALINVVTTLICLLILTFAIHVINKRQREYGYAKRVRIRSIVGTFIACIFALLLASYIYTFIGVPMSSQPNQMSLEVMFDRFPFIMFLMIVIVAPVCEELVFRELMPHVLGSSFISFIASSFLFVAIHSPSGIMGWTSYTIMAAGFTYARLRQKSIYASIGVHVVWNIVSILA